MAVKLTHFNRQMGQKRCFLLRARQVDNVVLNRLLFNDIIFERIIGDCVLY